MTRSSVSAPAQPRAAGPSTAPVPDARVGVASVLRNYLALTKPRVITLLLITTVPAMVVAAGGMPDLFLVMATLVGGALSAGGANAINCWYDRDIDALMSRTQARPVVTGAVAPAHALAFGIALGAAAFALLWVAATPAAAGISTVALLFYVFVYTAWLKRRTDQNIVIGGAAGAFPPVVGWAAVTGDVSIAAALMFLIIFLWTPPHFWALSIRLARDYGRAGVPMLPVTRGDAAARRHVFLYSLTLPPATAALWAFSTLGVTFLAASTVLGALFVAGAWRLIRDPERPSIGLYKYSLLYLALVFVAMAVDVGIAA